MARAPSETKAEPAAELDLEAEWLEADGLGGFASGTVGGIRTRRYHALLLAATTPPTGRFVLVNGWDAWVDTPAGSFPLCGQCYRPDVIHPEARANLEGFESSPWPTWTYRLPDGTRVVLELFARKDEPVVVARWRLARARKGVTLSVRPFLSGRDTHALHHENAAFRFDPVRAVARWTWRPYDGVPTIHVAANARYEHAPQWYRDFLYTEERARGFDCVEDLASPGVFRWDLSAGEAVCVLSAEVSGEAMITGSGEIASDADPVAWAKRLRAAEQRRRRALGGPLEVAADAYLVRRGAGRTIVAGYPWFTDWGRDAFIALRGLCLASGRLAEAREILLEWSGAVSEGMLPNRFAEAGDQPEFNSVDASLWFAVAVHDFLAAAERRAFKVAPRDRTRLQRAVSSILAGYSAGTRFGIRGDEDGLLACGVPGVQLTWMDAKVGDLVVTPRIGKPVEVQALWLNAMKIASAWELEWSDRFERGCAAFWSRFWNPDQECLYDVVDVDHVAGGVDASLRPNQIFAVGGLPFPLLRGHQARAVVDRVERRLLTPLGLRSLAPGEPDYQAHYRGGVARRDGAYHQGTVWPWLMGAFVEAWVRVRGGDAEARDQARERFLPPLMEHLRHAGLGHVSEVADAEPPYTPGGCPFQAWSLGELLRLEYEVLRADAKPAARTTPTRGFAKQST